MSACIAKIIKTLWGHPKPNISLDSKNNDHKISDNFVNTLVGATTDSIDVNGDQKIPKGGCVIVSNHPSMMDAYIMQAIGEKAGKKIEPAATSLSSYLKLVDGISSDTKVAAEFVSKGNILWIAATDKVSDQFLKDSKTGDGIESNLLAIQIANLAQKPLCPAYISDSNRAGTAVQRMVTSTGFGLGSIISWGVFIHGVAVSAPFNPLALTFGILLGLGSFLISSGNSCMEPSIGVIVKVGDSVSPHSLFSPQSLSLGKMINELNPRKPLSLE